MGPGQPRDRRWRRPTLDRIGTTQGSDLWGYDARAYRVDPDAPYALGLGELGAYLYSPVFAQVVGALGRSVPMELFLVAWTAASTAVYLWLGGRWAALFLLFPPVFMEIGVGNIHMFLTLAVVLGFRWPATWAFVLLTKITPAVGLAWFVARRDWRALRTITVVTLAIVAVSWAVKPELWGQWVDLLVDQARLPPLERLGVLPLGSLGMRLVVAAAIAFIGGLLGHRWPVLVAAMVAMPAVWVTTPSMLVGLVYLVALDRREPLPRMIRRDRPGRDVRAGSPKPVVAGHDP